MKKIFTLISLVCFAMGVSAQDVYVACPDGKLASEFAAVVGEGNVANNVVDRNSVVKIEKENITVEAVGSATPKDCTADGVSTWNDITWTAGNRGDISFYYVQGTGIAYTSWQIETMYENDGKTVKGYRCTIGTDDNGWPNFYVTDGSHGMPICGLYYKFMPKVAGTLKVGVWMNKGNRRLFFVPADTKVAMDYKVEGYVNGQNETYTKEDGTEGSRMKYMTNDELRALGSDKWVMGAGTQPAWVYATIEVEAGKEYWMFSQNAQVGFQGFEFTTSAGINDITTDVDKNAPKYNLAGQRVDNNYKGVVIQNGKKFMNK
ncbi:MAG: hypothetical protein J5957_01835 [Prevotella sp.]|nr:hypothetical protein [Prevotella sp.]